MQASHYIGELRGVNVYILNARLNQKKPQRLVHVTATEQKNIVWGDWQAKMTKSVKPSCLTDIFDNLTIKENGDRV